MNFDKLTKRNAKAFFELYMAGKDAAIEALTQLSAATGGPKANEFDHSIETLTPIWLWARDKIMMVKENAPDDKLPLWYNYEIRCNPHNTGIHFTPESADLIDKLAYYYGDTLIKHIPETDWSIDPYINEFYYCKPVVRSEYFTSYPVRAIYGEALLYIMSPEDPRSIPDALEKNVLRLIQREKDYRAYYQKNGGHDTAYKKATFD
jgi:hypothetical protein